MLVQRLRRWPNIKPTFGERLGGRLALQSRVNPNGICAPSRLLKMMKSCLVLDGKTLCELYREKSQRQLWKSSEIPAANNKSFT